MASALVTAVGDVLVDLSGIDQTAVGQYPTRLRREERMLVKKRHILPRLQRGVAVLGKCQLVRDLAAQHGLQQTVDFVLGNLLEHDTRAARHLDVDQRFGRTQADAADFDHVGLDFVAIEIGTDGIQRLLSARTQAARARAHEDRRPHQTIAPQLGNAVLPLLAHRLVLRAVGVQQPSEKFRVGGKHGRSCRRGAPVKQLGRHGSRPFSDKNPGS